MLKDDIIVWSQACNQIRKSFTAILPRGASIVLLSVLFFSCETLINTVPEDKLPRSESQLTFFSFISPQDSVIRVKVSYTQPIFGEAPGLDKNNIQIIDGDTIYLITDIFANAQVTISAGQSKATIPYDQATQTYALPTSRFPIVAGGTYQLTVTDGTRNASATCTIPQESVPIKSYTLDKNIVNRDTILILSFAWDDLPGKKNYYRVKAYEMVEFPVVKVDTSQLYIVETRKTARVYFNWVGTNSRNLYQSDANLDGAGFSSPQGRKTLENLGKYVISNPVPAQRGPESKGIYLQLLNTDENYFKFHRSLQQSRDDNPFAEPSLVFTNVRGGLGIFSGFNQSVKVVMPR